MHGQQSMPMRGMNVARFVGLLYSDLDCWQLVQQIYSDELDIDLPDVPGDNVDRSQWREIAPGDEFEGDILLFDTADGPHVGLCIGQGDMIHSDEANGVTIERYTRVVWKNQLRTIYRHR